MTFPIQSDYAVLTHIWSSVNGRLHTTRRIAATISIRQNELKLLNDPEQETTHDYRKTKAISLKEYTRLACLFAQVLRRRLSDIALLCAFGSEVGPATQPCSWPNMQRYLGIFFFGKRLSDRLSWMKYEMEIAYWVAMSYPHGTSGPTPALHLMSKRLGIRNPLQSKDGHCTLDLYSIISKSRQYRHYLVNPIFDVDIK